MRHLRQRLAVVLVRDNMNMLLKGTVPHFFKNYYYLVTMVLTAVPGGNKAPMNIISKLSKIIRICGCNATYIPTKLGFRHFALLKHPINDLFMGNS